MGYFPTGGRDAGPLHFWAKACPIGAIMGVIANMTCLNDNGIFTVMGMGPMTVNGDNTANPSMIKGKGAEMLSEKDNRPALIFIGTKGTGRHDETFPET